MLDMRVLIEKASYTDDDISLKIQVLNTTAQAYSLSKLLLVNNASEYPGFTYDEEDGTEFYTSEIRDVYLRPYESKTFYANFKCKYDNEPSFIIRIETALGSKDFNLIVPKDIKYYPRKR